VWSTCFKYKLIKNIKLKSFFFINKFKEYEQFSDLINKGTIPSLKKRGGNAGKLIDKKLMRFKAIKKKREFLFKYFLV